MRVRNQLTRRKMPFLKKLIWTYFLLLIFEGALRKWILPGLSAPLLLIRDPIALAIIWESYRSRRWPKKWSGLIAATTMGFLLLAMVQLITTQVMWVIIVYGLRCYILLLPVGLIMGEVLDSEDLRRFGACAMFLLIPLTALEIAQYYAPAKSFLNVGVGHGAEQIGYAEGHVRASATFSFTLGPAYFVPLVLAFILYGLIKPGTIKRWLMWSAGIAVAVCVPITGSRTLVAYLVLILVCASMSAIFGVSELFSLLKVFVVLVTISLIAAQLPFFSKSMGTLATRFSQSENTEGSMGEAVERRLLTPALEPLENAIESNNWLGNGIGLGSNVAAILLTGNADFLAGESEWERNIYEFGAVFGTAFIVFRLILSIIFTSWALMAARQREPLAFFLLPMTVSLIAIGIWEQATSQGFAAVYIGFTLAALKSSARTSPVPSTFPLHRPVRLAHDAGVATGTWRDEGRATGRI